MIQREDILKSPEYWIAKTQMDLYNCAINFMTKNKMNQSQLAMYLGVSKGYISQLLHGDYDHKLSKLVELTTAFGYIPKFEFMPINEFVLQDKFEFQRYNWQTVTYKNTSKGLYTLKKEYKEIDFVKSSEKHCA